MKGTILTLLLIIGVSILGYSKELQVVILDNQLVYSKFEERRSYPTYSIAKFFFLYANTETDTQDVEFFSTAQIGVANNTFETLFVEKTVSCLEKRKAVVVINGKRYDIENQSKDSAYPINFLSSTYKVYYQNLLTYWYLKIPNELIEKNNYKPFKLIIVRELYNGDESKLLDKKEFVYDLLPFDVSKNPTSDTY